MSQSRAVLAFVSLAILPAATASVSAQTQSTPSSRPEVGVEGGLAIASIRETENAPFMPSVFSARDHFSALFFIDSPITSVFGIRVDPGIVGRGAVVRDFPTSRFQIWAIEVPMLLRARIGSGAIHGFVLGGPALDVLAKKAEFHPDETDSHLRLMSLEAVVGGGVEVGRWRVEARYVTGLTNSTSLEGNGLTIKPWSFSLLAGASLWR